MLLNEKVLQCVESTKHLKTLRSETWNFREARFTNVLTSWNIAVRTIWELPHRAHRRYLAGVNGAHGKFIEQEIYARATMLYKKMERFLTQCCKNDSRSLMSRNTKHFKGGKDRNTIRKLRQTYCYWRRSNFLWRDLYSIKGFTKAELMDMYDHITVV